MPTFRVSARARRTIAALCCASLLAGGCCIRPPEEPTTAPFTDWTNLERLGVASVIVTLDGRDTVKGQTIRVTDTGIYLSGGSNAPRFLARDEVVRVVHVTSEAGARAKGGALVGLAFGGVTGFALGPGVALFALLIDPAGFAGLGALSGIPLKHETIVFERR